jgi:hypothetical protein
MKKASVMVVTIIDEVGEIILVFERMECRDTQISCISAKSLVGPLEACRP